MMSSMEGEVQARRVACQILDHDWYPVSGICRRCKVLGKGKFDLEGNIAYWHPTALYLKDSPSTQ